MKKLLISLVLAVASCSSAPAMAKADYTSIQCIKFIEGDWEVEKPKLVAELLKAADKNQAMLIEDLSDNDLVVAGTNLYCENISAKATLEWIGL